MFKHLIVMIFQIRSFISDFVWQNLKLKFNYEQTETINSNFRFNINSFNYYFDWFIDTN